MGYEWKGFQLGEPLAWTKEQTSVKGTSLLTSMNVSAQIRDRTVRMALVPLSNRPTLQDKVQQSTLEQDCGWEQEERDKEWEKEKERKDC